MFKGTVKFFNKAKGFGFITPDDGNKEIFLPASVVPASDAARLKTGQRVSYEQAPDTKGPKVVSLTFLDEAPRLPEAPAAPRINFTVFHASADPASAEVIAFLTGNGHQPRLVDYMVAPPPPDELRRLSLLLNGVDQSLVRRYDPLFLELQLDDRFITEGEFWTAVNEHPQLINGPVIVAANKVRICRSADDMRDFLGLDADTQPAKHKALSPRIAAMMMGVEPPPAPEPAPTPKIVKPKVVETVAVAVEAPAPVEVAPKPAPVKAKAPAKEKAPVAKPKPVVVAAKAKKAAPKTVSKAVAKPAAKAVKAVKKAVAKPVKKKAAAPAAKAKKKR